MTAAHEHRSIERGRDTGRVDDPPFISHEHTWRYEDDEYGSLADGGSYERYRCTECGRTKYVQLPD